VCEIVELTAAIVSFAATDMKTRKTSPSGQTWTISYQSTYSVYRFAETPPKWTMIRNAAILNVRSRSMQSTTLKSKMENLIRDLPENSSIEDAMEKLFLLYKIEKGIEQADAGLTVSHEEAKQRLDKWLD
jgi:predicted transcriptional regulator